MAVDVIQLGKLVEKELTVLNQIREEIGKVIVGQAELVDRLLIALLCNNHVLIEGVPGLAKTLTITTLAKTIQASFQRIQFTPDLLPGDLIGTLIYNPKSGDFSTRKGPIFSNIILADEINRAPAKVQSALLEAMQERQITIGDQSFPLDEPFMVLATQNPIEQEGTYPLPEAQIDRFMFKLLVTYPSKAEEQQILRRMTGAKENIQVNGIITPSDISRMRDLADSIYLDEKIEEYILNLVAATLASYNRWSKRMDENPCSLPKRFQYSPSRSWAGSSASEPINPCSSSAETLARKVRLVRAREFRNFRKD